MKYEVTLNHSICLNEFRFSFNKKFVYNNFCILLLKNNLFYKNKLLFNTTIHENDLFAVHNNTLK